MNEWINETGTHTHRRTHRHTDPHDTQRAVQQRSIRRSERWEPSSPPAERETGCACACACVSRCASASTVWGDRLNGSRRRAGGVMTAAQLVASAWLSPAQPVLFRRAMKQHSSHLWRAAARMLSIPFKRLLGNHLTVKWLILDVFALRQTTRGSRPGVGGELSCAARRLIGSPFETRRRLRDECQSGGKGREERRGLCWLGADAWLFPWCTCACLGVF